MSAHPYPNDPSYPNAPHPPTSRTSSTEPLSRATWEALAAPFPLDALRAIPLEREHRGSAGIVEFMPYHWAVIDRLNTVLGPGGYSVYHDVRLAGARPLTMCHLQIGGVWRSGAQFWVPEGLITPRSLIRAAQNFHVGWQALYVGHTSLELPVDVSALPDHLARQLMGEGLTSPLPWVHGASDPSSGDTSSLGDEPNSPPAE